MCPAFPIWTELQGEQINNKFSLHRTNIENNERMIEVENIHFIAHKQLVHLGNP